MRYEIYMLTKTIWNVATCGRMWYKKKLLTNAVWNELDFEYSKKLRCWRINFEHTREYGTNLTCSRMGLDMKTQYGSFRGLKILQPGLLRHFISPGLTERTRVLLSIGTYIAFGRILLAFSYPVVLISVFSLPELFHLRSKFDDGVLLWTTC